MGLGLGGHGEEGWENTSPNTTPVLEALKDFKAPGGANTVLLPSALNQTLMEYSREAPWSGLVEMLFRTRNSGLGPSRVGLLGTEISEEPRKLYPGKMRVLGSPSRQ